MHYSRVVPVVGHRRYFPSTAIFLVEVVKLVICSAVVLQELARSYSPISSIALVDKFFKSVFSPDSWKLAIPAALWTLQNSVIYVGISNLDPATFQVTYQLKILTTVLFSILLLGKTISHKQWLALVLLTAGVAIVQMSGLHISMAALLNNIQEMLSTTFILRTSPITNDPLRGSYTLELTPTNPAMNASLGIIAVVGASFISGITGVYFEKVLKESSTSATMWTRNIQLSFFSLFPALIFGVIGQDGHEIMREGFFVGYTGIVWTMIALQAVGGLIVAVCITYADNIAKNFAASISIVVSCIANALIFDVPLTANVSDVTASQNNTLLTFNSLHSAPPLSCLQYIFINALSHNRRRQICWDGPRIE